MFHDIAKPHTLTIDEKGVGHFYGHDKLGAKMARTILKRLKASNEIIEKVTLLIDKHMTQHADYKEKGLKKLLAILGEDEIFTLLKLQKADRLCSNVNADISDLIDREKKIKTKKMIRFYIWRLLSLIIITLFSFLIGFYIVSEKAKKIKIKELEIQKKIGVK